MGRGNNLCRQTDLFLSERLSFIHSFIDMIGKKSLMYHFLLADDFILYQSLFVFVMNQFDLVAVTLMFSLILLIFL